MGGPKIQQQIGDPSNLTTKRSVNQGNRGTWKSSLDLDITGSDVDEPETVNESIGELLVEAGGLQFKLFSCTRYQFHKEFPEW